MEKNLWKMQSENMLEDQFFVSVTPDGKNIATGGYCNSGHMIDISANNNVTIPCDFKVSRDTEMSRRQGYNFSKTLPSSSSTATGQWVENLCLSSPFSTSVIMGVMFGFTQI